VWAESSGARAIAHDGSLLGPFNPLLFKPVLGTAYLEVLRADEQSTSLSARVHEIVILTVGAAGRHVRSSGGDSREVQHDEQDDVGDTLVAETRRHQRLRHTGLRRR
jgi:hypothetical protein